jgi:hypothetical protein
MKIVGVQRSETKTEKEAVGQYTVKLRQYLP